MDRREFLERGALLGASALAGLGCDSAQVSASRRPNVVLILADDLGYGDVGSYGCDDIRTEAIDALAEQGVRFTHFYANAPECTPTRTALLTGRYQHRVGGLECALGIGNVGRYDDAIRLRQTHDLGLPAEETTIARMLKEAGYATACVGKWHLGYERKFFPDRHGFDYSFGPIGGSADYFHHIEYTGENALYENGKPVKRHGYMTDLISDEAVRFVRRNRGRPFFLYVAYTAPHTPYQGPGDAGKEPVAEADYNLGDRRTYRAMVESMDAGVGRIVAVLEECGMIDNTLVIFASDNGANNKGRNAPFSGFKGGLFEGGIRVLCVVRFDGRIKAGTVCDQPAMTMDLSRSIVRLAGVRPAADRLFDGMDILDHVENERVTRGRNLFWRARRGERTWKAVRSGDLKYICRQDGQRIVEYLFDLASDSAEKHNVLADRRQEAVQLKDLLAVWEVHVQHHR